MLIRAFSLAVVLNVSTFMGLAAQDAAFPRYTLNGQVRHRLEVNNNDLNSETSANTFNLLRTRLGLRFFPIERIEAFVQVQDSRTFGEETSTLADGNADQLDFHQGYLQIVNLFDWALDLQIGRFEANYGSQRLIGAVGWHNVGRSFDGVRVRIHPENARIDLFNLKIDEQMQPGETGDMNMYGVYGDFDLIENAASHAFLIWQRRRPGSELNRYTAGLFLSGGPWPFAPELELAYQGGELNGANVSAFMATINLGYAISQAPLHPTISAGFDLLSGDDAPAQGDFKVFDTLYATNHKFYGAMDYFIDIPTHTSGLGLQDFHAGITLNPRDDLSVQVTYHNFSANRNFIFGDGSSSARFGNEVDVTLVFNYNNAVTFTGGASVFTPGRIFEETRGADAGFWAYFMTSVNL